MRRRQPRSLRTRAGVVSLCGRLRARARLSTRVRGRERGRARACCRRPAPSLVGRAQPAADARRMVSSSSTSADRSVDAVTCVVHKPTTVRVTCYVCVFAFVRPTLHVVRTGCRHSETPARLYSGSREAQLISARPRLFATLSLSLRDIRCCLYTGRGPVSRLRPL